MRDRCACAGVADMARRLWADLRPHLEAAQQRGQSISLGGHRRASLLGCLRWEMIYIFFAEL